MLLRSFWSLLPLTVSHLEGRLGNKQCLGNFEILLLFPNFLKTSVLNCSPTYDVTFTQKYVSTYQISGSVPSGELNLHLNVVKFQNIKTRIVEICFCWSLYLLQWFIFLPAGNYIYSKLTIETLEQGLKYVQS